MNESLLGYFYHADMVVKGVMLILLVASVLSWMFIFQRGYFLKMTTRALNEFEKQFWSAKDVASFYSELLKDKKPVIGVRNIFKMGFKAYLLSEHSKDMGKQDAKESVERAMAVAILKENEQLEKHLAFLASVGSVSPYIGLFGTVWGIMSAFKALSNVQQVSIAMVAPGISEALVATALGLFTAIPAVLAYNRYVNQVEIIQSRYEIFKDEFQSLLAK